MERIRILLVDDEPLVRTGLRMRLSVEADIAVVGETGSGEDALIDAEALHPDVILLDYRMTPMDGIETLSALMATGSEASVVMLSGQEIASLAPRALQAGAAAFVSKHESSSVLLSAIRRAATLRLGGEHPS
jgi:DNA-binding NarL/FixJ family response regulator